MARAESRLSPTSLDGAGGSTGTSDSIAAQPVSLLRSCRSAEALATRLKGLGEELGIPASEAGLLLTALPPLFAINTFSLVKDK